LTRRLSATLCAALLLAFGGATVLQAPAEAAVPSETQWRADVYDAMVGSQRYVDSRADSGAPGLAVNLDIDNTSLASHYAYGEAVHRVLRFARDARAHGVVLLFNTGRVAGDGRIYHARLQLIRAGYLVTEICGRTSASEGLSHSKRRCRQHFVGEGYTVVANVGNRSTDFTGGNYERAYRLPSYDDQLA
jgi:hypothetical protein